MLYRFGPIHVLPSFSLGTLRWHIFARGAWQLSSPRFVFDRTSTIEQQKPSMLRLIPLCMDARGAI